MQRPGAETLLGKNVISISKMYQWQPFGAGNGDGEYTVVIGNVALNRHGGEMERKVR